MASVNSLAKLRAAMRAGTRSSSSKSVNSSTPKFKPLSPAQKAYLDRVIRVDQAGELGADLIYAGQFAVLKNSPEPGLRDTLQHMWDQEIHHRNTFNKLQVKHRVRPSLLTPMWKLGAYGIGVSTALLGKEAAMACTVAVETVIGGHYNTQLRVLVNEFSGLQLEAGGAEYSPELENIITTVKSFRDDELEHLNTAVENDAEKAVPYWPIVEGVKGICRVAIWTAERF